MTDEWQEKSEKEMAWALARALATPCIKGRDQ